ncbi:MAG: hypothetical protein ACW99A_15710 [Candidatus Kariarchaeaceae archaeon]|jgi:hypothetical protein
MKRKSIGFLLIGVTLFLSLWGFFSFSLGISADIGVPAEGTVVEGVNVPGISLGFSRAEVISSYGPPNSCQGSELSFCKYQIPEGSLFITYRGSDGGEATGSDSDVVHSILWYYLSGWVTTAGINTDIAYNDYYAVINAYPNAVLTYNQWGSIFSAIDYQQGIEVVWERHLYPIGYTTLHMKIFYPREPPEPRVPTLYSDNIDLTVVKNKVLATVTVKNDLDYRIQDATVSAIWTLPDGSTEQATALTNAFGEAKFEIKKSHGTFIFTVSDITLDGYVFDPDNSMLSNLFKKILNFRNFSFKFCTTVDNVLGSFSEVVINNFSCIDVKEIKDRNIDA